MGAEKFGLIFLSSRVRLNMRFSDSFSETTKMCEGKNCYSSGQRTCMGLDAELVQMGITSSISTGCFLVLLCFPRSREGKTASNFFPMTGKVLTSCGSDKRPWRAQKPEARAAGPTSLVPFPPAVAEQWQCQDVPLALLGCRRASWAAARSRGVSTALLAQG